MTEKYKTNKYYEEVDVVKGIAILLVVMGHSFCTRPIDIAGNVPQFLMNIIRTVQMPLFFFASGFLFSKREEFKDFLRKKIARLIVPCLAFSILSIMLRFAFAPFTNSGAPSISESLINIVTGEYYWFLYSLFLVMLVCKTISNKCFLYCIALLFACTSIYFQEIDSMVVSKTLRLFLFFVLGMDVKPFYEKLIQNKVFLGIGVFCMILYLFSTNTQFYISENIVVKAYIAPLTGIVGIWTLTVLLKDRSALTPCFKYFGKYSLQYYLNHLLIMLPCYFVAKVVDFSNPILSWVLIVLLGLAVSWCMLQVEKKVEILRVFCGLK